MKATCLLGSPRKNGNSAIIADYFVNQLNKNGVSTQTFALNELNYKGCQGCMACKNKLDKCILKDDLTKVLEEIRDSDVWVLSSPVYCGEATASIRAFVERVYSFAVPDFLTNPIKSRLKLGKKLVFIVTQGNPDENLFTDIFPKYERFFKIQGFSDFHVIRACGVRDEGDVNSREDIFKLTEKIAAEIMK